MSESDSKIELEIEEIKKNFESNFLNKNFPFSIFEFREIFDRYVGLSIEVRENIKEISPAETEIFRITNHNNKNLAEICLNRRNRKQLSFHQKLAGRDFFEIFRKLFDKSFDSPMLIKQAIRLADLLNDFEARKLFENLSNESLQTKVKPTVKNPEDEIWKSEKHKPLTDTKISTNLQALTARANLSNKD